MNIEPQELMDLIMGALIRSRIVGNHLDHRDAVIYLQDWVDRKEYDEAHSFMNRESA